MEGEMALLIPILALSIPFFAIWTKHKQKIAEMQVETAAENTAEKAAQYASNVKALEDRVAVLERIVTDSGYDVATQIEALRDTKSVEDTGAGIPLDIKSQEKA
jgi:hypothetical protein